jgi:predicted hydrocarbon binding protein
VVVKGKERGTLYWARLGDIKEGRGNLGEEMPVLVYRLMQFTLLDVLTKEHGREKANDYLRAAGHLAGTEFARNVLDLKADFDCFVANLQKTLWELKIGILRIEEINENAQEIILPVAEDLDCSGLPITDETVCDYDEGFIAGILESYTGKPYSVREIDCWATGNRVCRFKCNVTI